MESRLLAACAERLVCEIAPRALVLAAHLPGENRCELLLESSPPERRRTRLVVDLAPARACLYLARPASTPAEGDSPLRSLAGRWIVGVDRPLDLPLLRLLLSGPGEESASEWLIFEWLGGRPEAVVVDARTETVLASLHEEAGPHAARRARGAAYRWPDPPRRPRYSEATSEQVEEILASDRRNDPAGALSRGFAGLPPYLAHEAIIRGAGDPGRTAAALREIADAPFEPTLYRLVDPAPGLPPVFVSPIPLASFDESRSARPGSLFHLLEHAHEAVLREERKVAIRDSFLRLVDGEIVRLTRLHGRLAEESRQAGQAPGLRRSAEALLVHAHEIPRGAKRFACTDPGDPGERLVIDLDPALTVPANADRLFRRARRLERGEPLRRRRIQAIEETVIRLSELKERAREAGPGLERKGGGWLREALGRFVHERAIESWERRIGRQGEPRETREKRRQAGRRAVRGKRGGKAERFHPRTYKTREGWTILVGRSNAENDHVSHALARPEDYWFHVHGCPGSHVVLRWQGQRDNPSRRTIEEVAAIAAYFSKARSSRKVPVVYTLKKYVRKPRGAAPGLALVEREKTIMVEPRAPDEADPGGWGDDSG